MLCAFTVFNGTEKDFYALNGHFLNGLLNGAQFRNQKRAVHEAVEPEHGNVFRNTKAVVVKCPDCADGHYVLGSEERREISFVFKKAAGCVITVLIGKTDTEIILVLIEIKAVLKAGSKASFETKASRIGSVSVAADYGDSFVAKFDKRIHRAFCRKAVIG